MKRSRRELSIDMVIHRGIFKNNQTTLLFRCFTFIHKTGTSFYCEPEAQRNEAQATQIEQNEAQNTLRKLSWSIGRQAYAAYFSAVAIKPSELGATTVRLIISPHKKGRDDGVANVGD